MPHSYPLHTDVMAQCFCCRSLQPFRFTSASDQVVCSFCQNHLGAAKAERRDVDHIKMWSELLDDEQEVHREYVAGADATTDADRATIAHLRTQVAELTTLATRAFDTSEAGEGRELFETAVITRAERNTELANRRTDRVMSALWSLDQLHHDDPTRSTHCVCGKTLAACAEGKLLEPERRALREWEQKNLALAVEGKRHALPKGHPSV